MTITIVPICHDCNEELSNWDRFLNKKYPNTLGYTLCSSCEKKREEKQKLSNIHYPGRRDVAGCGQKPKVVESCPNGFVF